MGKLIDYLGSDHRRCDALLAAAEAAAERADWRGAAQHFDAFREAILHHLAAEEDVLFPAFEQASGMLSGPTAVMRGEHRWIRDMLGTLGAELRAENAGQFAGAADTLHLMLQQHNIKEESILYPMAERALGADCGALLESIRELDTHAQES